MKTFSYYTKCFFFVLLFLLFHCSLSNEKNIFHSPLGIILSIFYPSTNEISRYTLEKKNNPTLHSNVSSEILGRKIKLNVPYGTQTDGLIASYDTTAKSVWVKDVPQQSGITSNDFTNALTYQTVAPDNTLALYEASVELGKEYSKEMKVFGFSKKYNPSIVDDTKGVFIGYNINVILPYGSFGSDGPESKQRRLIASYITSGKNVFSGGIEQSSEETINDFSALKTYKITATDGSFAEYNVTVSIAAESAKELLDFMFTKDANPNLPNNYQANITDNNITATFPSGTNVSSLTPSFITSGQKVEVDGIKQRSNFTSNNFSNAVTYTVTAADKSVKNYYVTVSITNDSITSFSFDNPPATGIIYGSNILLTVLFGTDLTRLTPTVFHTGILLTPESGVAQNFSIPLTYTVTAKDGTTKSYKVTVNTTASTSKDITLFNFTNPPAVGNIEGANITLTVPYGTGLSALTPHIYYTGIGITPAANIPQNFTTPVEYTVIAQDSSTQKYTVTVNTMPASTAKNISLFYFTSPTVYATISGANITAVVPFGTDVSNLVPSIVYSGVKIEPSLGTAINFTNPVVYTVTAQDGTSQQYTVTVSINKTSDKSITLFNLTSPSVTGSISGTNITVNVPFGTSVTSLTPNVFHNGYSISPNTGVSQNFSTPVLYTVTAQDGTTQTYTVNVIVVDATVTTPTFSVNGGSYTNDQTVSITCTTAGAAIYYTTDGNLPSTASTLYMTPVVLSGSGYKTLRAIAVKNGMLDSGIKTESYYIQPLTVSYAGSPFTFTNGTAITEKLPTASKAVATYSITPSLPNGMTFNTTTGGIGGTPNTTSEENVTTTYTITATTPNGETVNIALNITIRIIRICYTWGCFEDQLNGTVRFTGSGSGGGYDYTGVNLTWMKCSQGQTWNATTNGCDGSELPYQYCPVNNNLCDNGTILTQGPAFSTCNNLVFAGLTGWRVPILYELKTLIHCTNKMLPNDGTSCGDGNYMITTVNTFFSNTTATFYWSSSTSNSGYSWMVYFFYGHNGTIPNNTPLPVRCVRTGL